MPSAPFFDEKVKAQLNTLTDSSDEGAPKITSDFPVMIWVGGRKVTPGLVDTVSTNMRHMLGAFGVPVVAVLYYRIRGGVEDMHLFIAVDERERVIRVPPARLAMLTGAIDAVKLKEYTGSVTADPLGALLLKVGGRVGERLHRFPPIFGFRAPQGEKQIYDRTPELESLRRDGYFALTFLPVAGVDHRMQLVIEIASVWGYSIAGHDARWPDLLVLRNDTPERDDLGGVPDETWIQHALSRVMEDHLPVVEIDGLWMGSIPRGMESRARVFYAVLDWVRMRRLPYITARTFHCYVRRDLSAVVALGSLRDRMELIEWLDNYPFGRVGVAHVKGETPAAIAVFSGRDSRDIAIRDSSAPTSWLVIHGPEATSTTTLMPANSLEENLRTYYGSPETCNAPGSPVTAADVASLNLDDLLKIVRIAECEAAASGVCLLGSGTSLAREKPPLPESWTASHRAYRAAVRSQVLRVHDTIGVYRLGQYASPFFAFEVHQYIPMPPESRYRPAIHQVQLAPDIGESEDNLLKTLLGTVWLLTVQESATATMPASEIDILQVASNRDGEEVRRIVFDAWKTGHLIGIWCKVMLTHRDSLSVSAAGGTVDPLLAHAGDSIVDGERWLTITQNALAVCRGESQAHLRLK